MTKVFLQPGLRGLSGAMGDWVYQIRNGKTIVGMKALTTQEPSDAQLAHRERFKKAAVYAKGALANGQREFYELMAKQKDVPAFALAVTDFLKPPSITEVNLNGYDGQVGSTLAITTTDDTGVVNVHVALTYNQGTVIESGQAVEYPIGSGLWTYSATSNAPGGQIVDIVVTAKDRPGGTAIHTSTKEIEGS